MGWLDKLFGTGDENPAKRSVEEGRSCAKCGAPVLRDNMAFDSGGGGVIHRSCPAPEAEPGSDA